MHIQLTNLYAQVQPSRSAQMSPISDTKVVQQPSTLVKLSAQAQTLAKSDRVGIPENPPLVHDGQYLQAKKSMAKYNAYQNLTDQHLSAKEAYMVKNNDELRQALVAKEAMDQQAKLLQVYANNQQDQSSIYYVA